MKNLKITNNKKYFFHKNIYTYHSIVFFQFNVKKCKNMHYTVKNGMDILKNHLVPIFMVPKMVI